MRLGIDAPEDFWHPVFAHRYHIQPWDMWRVRVDHLDEMLKYLKDIPTL